MNRLLLTGISVIGLSAFLLGCQGEQSVAQKTTSIVPISTTQADKNMGETEDINCLLYTSPSSRDRTRSRMPSSA